MAETGVSGKIESIEPAVRSAAIRPAPVIDPYSKEAAYCTTGKDMVFRRVRGADGRINWSVVPAEEVEAARLPKKSRSAKRLRKGMGR